MDRQPEREQAVNPSAPSALAQSAQWMAAARARESRQTNRLFNDPFAGELAGEAGFTGLELINAPAGWFGPERFAVIRTRFFDDFLRDVCWRSHVRQVVLLAAGLDTRAFRLDWPAATRLYEIDLPAVLERKAEVLASLGAQPRCELAAVRCDLADSGWPRELIAAGYQADLPAVWIVEGLLFYLQPAAVHRLLETLFELVAADGRLGLDVVNQDLLTSPLTLVQRTAFEWLGAPGRFGTNDPLRLINRHGWSGEVVELGEEGGSFGRWPRPLMPRWVAGVPRCYLVRGRRL